MKEISSSDLANGITDEPTIMALALSICHNNPPCNGCLRDATNAFIFRVPISIIIEGKLHATSVAPNDELIATARLARYEPPLKLSTIAFWLVVCTVIALLGIQLVDWYARAITP